MQKHEEIGYNDAGVERGRAPHQITSPKGNALRKLLFIDDDCDSWKDSLGLVFKAPEWEMTCEESPEDGLELLMHSRFDLVLLDLGFPEAQLQGKDVLTALKEKQVNVPVIVLTGSESAREQRTAIDCMKLGAIDYFPKADIDLRRLLVEANVAVEAADTKHRKDRLTHSLERVTGALPLFKTFFAGKHFICVFGAELVAMGAFSSGLSKHAIDDFIQDQFNWHICLIRGLHGGPSKRELELRYISDANSNRLKLALLGRTHGSNPKQALELGKEFWLEIKSFLKEADHLFPFEPLSGADALEGLLRPFEPRSVVEILRTGTRRSRPNRVGFRSQGRYPAQSVIKPHPMDQNRSTFHRLCQQMLDANYPLMITVYLECDEPDLQDDIRHFIDNYVVTCDSGSGSHIKGPHPQKTPQNVTLRLFVAGEKIESHISRTIAQEMISDKDKMWEIRKIEAAGIGGILKEYGIQPVGLKNEEILLPVFTVAEAAGIFRLPLVLGEVPGIPNLKPSFFYLPDNIPDTGTLIGKKKHAGSTIPIHITAEDMAKHVYVLGQTGTGKSTLLTSMIYSDICAGKGLCVLDPHGDLVDSLIDKIPDDRINDVILFDPSDSDWPIGLNLLEGTTERDKDYYPNELIQFFIKLFDPRQQGIVGPQFEQAARAAGKTVMCFPEGGTVVDIPRLFEDGKYLKSRLDNIEDPIIKGYWEKVWMAKSDFHKSEWLGWLSSKFEPFRQNNTMRRITGQAKSSINLREIMDNGKILLVNLAKGQISELSTKYLGLVLVSRIFGAALTRQDTDRRNRRPFSLYVDEFQNFTSDSVESLLSESRKYGLSIILAHQNMYQLERQILEGVLGNVNSLIFFRPGPLDATRVAPYTQPEFTEADLLDLPNWTAIARIMINNVPSKPFAFETCLLEVPPNTATRKTIIKNTRSRYARPKEDVDKEIADRMVVDKQIADLKVSLEKLRTGAFDD